ncbi:MAG: universal stress protein, partial [bacterium]
MPAISKILFPTDFSTYSNSAMEHAVAWANRFGASVHMLHVVTMHSYDPFNPDLGFPEVALDETLRETAEEHLEELAEEAGRGPGPAITQEIRTGFSSWHEIMDAAEEQSADLIVMATRGRKGLEKVFLGSTAEKVVEHAECPVLLLRPREEEGMPPAEEIHRIMLPSDFSTAASQAAPVAVELAQKTGASLALFHCVEQDVPPPYYAAGVTSIFDLNDDVLSMARERLAELLPEEYQEEVEHEFVVREGRSAQEIVSYARESATDLIVM